MALRGMKWLLVALTTLTLAKAQGVSNGALASTRSIGIDWAPCKHPCKVSLQCATLAVPLNYTAGDSEEKIELQLTKVNALKQPSKGSILFNPGGPGATGRGLIRARDFGLAAQYMTGGEYDLVSFNPRGTGNTLPLSCGKELDDGIAQLGKPPKRSLKERNVTIPDTFWEEQWLDTEYVGAQCSKGMAEHGSLIGPTFTARDMMRIVDSLGEDGLLRYWGMSYGTVLGATAAAMFPDRMDKVVLDGVVNLAQYWSGEMLDSPMDTEAVIDGFFSSCVKSPELCKLAADNSSAMDLRKKFDDFIKQLESHPAQRSTSFEVRSLIAESLLFTENWPQFAVVLDDWFKHGVNLTSETQSSLVAAMFGRLQEDPALELANIAIRCSDSKLRANNVDEVNDEILPLVHKLQAVAPTLGDKDAAGLVGCTAWKMSAEERYTNPLNNITTRNPILFIGNTYDPRTPLASAQNASAAFPGSALLTHHGYGHCSGAQPSLCIGKAVKAYFTHGTLPKEGTVCEPSIPPFHDPALNLDTVESHLWTKDTGDSDEALLAAWKHVGSEMARGYYSF